MTDLLPMMQALVIVFQHRQALLAAGDIVGGGVDDVAGEQVLPEGKTPGGTCGPGEELAYIARIGDVVDSSSGKLVESGNSH